MSRSGRLIDMVTLLQGRRELSLKEMASRYDVSERTVYRDLAELQDWRFPITRGERGYRLVEGARMRPLHLTTAERAILKVALANPAIRRHRGLGRHLDLVEAKLDALATLGEETPQALALTGVERSGEAPAEVVESLERAVHDRRATEILYASLTGGDRRWRGVDPYRLFHRDGAWYLAGRCHTHDEPRIFRLDRVAGARPLAQRFSEPGFDLETFLAGSWSVYRGDQEHQVVLHAEAALAPLLANARHHESEELRELPDGGLEYRVELTHLDEIARWVVGFGGRVRVVEPEELRERVVGLAEGVLAEGRGPDAAS